MSLNNTFDYSYINAHSYFTNISFQVLESEIWYIADSDTQLMTLYSQWKLIRTFIDSKLIGLANFMSWWIRQVILFFWDIETIINWKKTFCKFKMSVTLNWYVKLYNNYLNWAFKTLFHLTLFDGNSDNTVFNSLKIISLV